MPWNLKDLELVFVTCPRTPYLLPVTLASGLLADSSIYALKKIHAVADTPDLEWIELFTRHQRICWMARNDEQNRLPINAPVHQRASYNYWRALQCMASGSQGIIVCEDDIVFRDGWLRMLLEALNEMCEDGITAPIVSLYSPHDHENDSLRRGRFYSSYFASSFYGTQSMFFSADQLSAISRVVLSESARTFRLPYDLAISGYCTEQQNLYTTRHSLVQHIGRVSTGLGDGRHTSPSFDRIWPGS